MLLFFVFSLNFDVTGQLFSVNLDVSMVFLVM